MTPLDYCDEQAGNLTRAYQSLGLPAFVLCVRKDGNVTAIGPVLKPEVVARMLHTAADAYLAQVNPSTAE